VVDTGARRPIGAVLAADVVSTLGTEMTAVALPWFVLVTTGSPIRTGAVLAAEFAGLTLLGLAGGGAAARLGPRRLMLGSDLARAILIGLIPLQYALGTLTYPVVLVVAFAVGGFFPAYNSSQRLVVAGFVGDDEVRLTRFGGLATAVNEMASFVGPALGGVLVAFVGAPNVLLLDAGSYLCAFALVAVLVPARPSTVSTEEDGSIGAGIRYLLRHRSLRWEVGGLGVVEVAFAAMMATMPVIALRSGGGATAAGWMVGAYGAGAVAGGLISARSTSAGPRTATVAVWGVAASATALLMPAPLWTTAVFVGLIGVGNGIYFPRFFAALTTGTPPALRATVMTAATVAISAPGPVGFVGAGLLNQYVAGRAAGLGLVAVAALVGAATVTAARVHLS
jgi:MFS family permease